MIFRPELVEKILAGEKTETRRPAGSFECRYKPGRTYAVQPARTKPGVARILVKEIRREELGEIRHSGALREGFRNVTDFLIYWEKLYGRVDLLQEVWVIRFELAESRERGD